MKKLLLTTAALALVTGALAQGTVQFNTRLTAGSPPYYSQVFAPEADNSYKSGNTSLNLPAGMAFWTAGDVAGGDGRIAGFGRVAPGAGGRVAW